MKKVLVIALLVLGSLTIHAQVAVNFEFSGGIENTQLKAMMERQISNLLTAINRAEAYNVGINYSGIYVDNLAMQSINKMWENVHMKTRDNNIREASLCVRICSGSLSGYQVRNIAVRMVPVKDDCDENVNQEICIDFDRNGKITGFNLTLGLNQYTKILNDSKKLDDLNKRLMIVHWLEQLRSAFYIKDICFLENVFCDDALIINDKFTRRVANEVLPVYYQQINKQKYIDNLRKVFKRNACVNVQFDEIEIARYGVNPNIYGVTVSLHWNTSTYSDAGWLFVIWDFTDECYPKLLVRTWQDKKDYTREQVITLDDFEFE